MRKVFDLTLTMLFSLIIAGPTALFIADSANLQLPSWLTAEDAQYLSGRITDGNVKTNLNLESFAEKGLQTAVENEVGNYIPCKAAAMLADAAWQRKVIAAANLPFGWNCYPTYFGSSRIYIPNQNALAYIPKNLSQERLDTLAEFGTKLSAFAKRHPQNRFVVYVVQGYQEPAANPADQLVVGATTSKEQANALINAVPHISNVKVLTKNYNTAEEYYCDFFRTDHHWNWRGCERAFNQIADAIHLGEINSENGRPIDGYRFSGATARWGRFLIEESVEISNHDFSTITITAPDGSSAPYGHSAFFERTDPGIRFGFYDSYYGFLSHGSTLEGVGSRNCLLLCNSYGAAIAPYVASSYKKTKKSDILHPSYTDSKQRLSKLLETDDIDDVIFVANPTNISIFIDACPDFFRE